MARQCKQHKQETLFVIYLFVLLAAWLVCVCVFIHSFRPSWHGMVIMALHTVQYAAWSSLVLRNKYGSIVMIDREQTFNSTQLHACYCIHTTQCTVLYGTVYAPFSGVLQYCTARVCFFILGSGVLRKNVHVHAHVMYCTVSPNDMLCCVVVYSSAATKLSHDYQYQYWFASSSSIRVMDIR
jgi:hypothetical protein